MKIDRIETIHLRFEYPGGKGFDYAGGVCTARLSSLVRVHTDTGRIGTGSVYAHPGLVELVVTRQLAPLLRGRDPREVESLWSLMYGLTRWYGRKGAAVSALGGLDTAFWDLRAQDRGVPLWKLLGGRGECPAYASGLLWKEPAALAEEAERHIARGFRRVKMRMGRSEEYDTTAVRAVRQAIGSDNDLIVDASMRYTVPIARRVGKVLAENRVFWFEEPFTPEDLDSYKALRGTVNVPIAAGENEFGVQGFRELIREKAVDVVQPDACRCGGVSELVKIGEMARAAGLKVGTHTWSDAVALLANAHAVANMPHGLTQTGNPMIDELLVEPLDIRDGVLRLPDKPGLGVELNEATLERWRLPDPLNIPDGNYSDMVFGPQHLTPAGPYAELA
jgi:D-galactarolactone cycloisomerase